MGMDTVSWHGMTVYRRYAGKKAQYDKEAVIPCSDTESTKGY